MARRQRTRTTRRTVLGAMVLAMTLVAGPGYGDDDHARARAARQAGEIRPLAEVMAAVKRDMAGDVIEVELEREHGRWIYEVKILTPDGVIRRLDYDALSGQRLPARGRHGHEPRRP